MLRSESAATSVSMVSFSSFSHGSTTNHTGHSYKNKILAGEMDQLSHVPGKIKKGCFVIKGNDHMIRCI